MPKGADVTGAELVEYFQKHSFSIVSQRGSHVTLRNTLGQWTTIPVHNKPLWKWLLAAIFRQVGMSKSDFLK